MSNAAIHGRALRTVGRYGKAWTFTNTTAGTHDPIASTWTQPTKSTVSGKAVEIATGEAKMRREGEEATQQIGKALFFVPDTFGGLPAVGSIAMADGEQSRSVKAVDPIRPDGNVIAARVYLT